jgi:hypothetical protein
MIRMALFSDDDSLDDIEIDSIRDLMPQRLEKTSPSDTNRDDLATSTEPISRRSIPDPKHPRRPSVSSGSIDLTNNLSVSSDEEAFDDHEDNTRKRKQSVASLEEDDHPTPSITTPSTPLEPLPDDAQASQEVSEVSSDEEDIDNLDSQSQRSEHSSMLTSPPLSLLNSNEAMSDDESQLPDQIRLAFSKLPPQKIAEVQRIGNQLFLRDFDLFLEKYSGIWKASGFWKAPSWNASKSSNHLLQPNRAGLMTYLVGLHNESDVHDVKLRIARVSLFLFFEREVKSERHRGVAETSLKRNAVSNLCNSKGLGAVEKRKLHQTFNSEKKIGEYWWWCTCYFGPSFLLRCSREAGKKM